MLEALGLGQRREVGWMLDERTSQFRARVGDAAPVSRNLIRETWGRQPGVDRAELERRVAERKRTGLPKGPRPPRPPCDELARVG